MRETALPPADPATSPAARMKSSLYKTDRSHSEVGDTLRYFNSVSSSKSWCGDVGSYGGYGGGSELYLGGGACEDGLALSLSLSEDASSLGNDNLGYGRISGGSGGSGGGRGAGRNKCRSGSAQVLGVSSPVGAARFNSVVGCYQVDQM